MKLRKNDEAVSPVIAIILMVAITVVLAGVLYVWVTGLADTEGGASDVWTVDFEDHPDSAAAGAGGDFVDGELVIRAKHQSGALINWDDYDVFVENTDGERTLLVVDAGAADSETSPGADYILGFEYDTGTAIVSGDFYSVVVIDEDGNEVSITGKNSNIKIE